jgi:D-3-phosphoglycerate dehydrogenase / 2-oxoglutarate reductase
MKKHFLITETVPGFFIKDLVKSGFEVENKPNISLAELKQSIGQYHAILIRSRITLDKELLDLATNLRMIFRPGSGLDIIDMTAAAEKNIKIFNSPEGNRDAVGEHAAGLLLCLLNHIHSAHDEIIHGKWNRKANSGIEIKGKKIGIIGFGHTGSAFAKIVSSFGAEILAYDKYKSSYAFPPVKETSMEEIFTDADIVSYHIPLNSETKYLINTNYLKNFQKPIFLLNTSRGKILDTNALLEGINKNMIRGAALDVLENEKPETYTIEEKELMNKLIASGRVLFTPHVAGLTIESEEKIFSILINKLLRYNDL